MLQSSYGTKSFLRAPQTGQNQSSGMSSNAVPGAMPAVGVALRGVVDEPAGLADPFLGCCCLGQGARLV